MPELTIEQALQVGMAHHRAGRLADAESLYRQILAHQPNHPGALHLMGLIVWHAGQLELADELIRRAMVLAPNAADFCGNLSKLQLQRGRHEEAISLARQALQMKPDDPLCHFTLAAALQAHGDLEGAAHSYRNALRLKPDYAMALNNLGIVLRAQGNSRDAMDCFQRALALDRNSAEIYGNLAVMWQTAEDHLKAIDAFREGLRIKPDNVEMLFGLGFSLSEMTRFNEAIAAYQHTLRLNPSNARAYNNLGSALRALGNLDDAEAAYREALRLQPDMAEAWNNLGVVLDGKAAYEEALVCYRRAIELKPDSARLHSNLVYTLHFQPASTPASLLEEHREWARRHAEPLKQLIQPHTVDVNPDRRLRIGYVSPDLRNHVVGRFLLPLLEEHDRSGFEISCLTSVRATDAITARLRAGADHWHSLIGKSDQEVAELIRRERIDILVDLTMHMEGNRLLVFAQKPAPVQVTYLAYCSTTGLETIDYRFTDIYLDPPDTDLSCYTEKSVHLESYWCYAESSDAAPLNDPPVQSTGRITFGCLNSFSKVSQEALETWGRILRAVPESRLLLHANPGSHRQRVRDFLSGMGVAPERCEFADQVLMPEYFRLYHQIDIGLDPFPYAGGTTTCDALWMGVPVVTLAGKTAVGRGGVSILSAIGMGECAAISADEYVEVAVALARQPKRLAELRATLRDRMQHSPLMDAPRFARHVEAAFRGMWRTWCAAQSVA